MAVTFAILAYDGIEPIDIGATYGVLSMARRIAPELRFFVVSKSGGASDQEDNDKGKSRKTHCPIIAKRGPDDHLPLTLRCISEKMVYGNETRFR